MYTTHDKLIMYGVLMALVPVITLSIMKIYCHRHYDECIIAPRRYWDKSLVKHISDFFGWNFLTAISSLFSAQGIGIVLNHFFGSLLNAAQGIAVQVSGSVSTFSGNMMKAINPVITKSAGSNDLATMNFITLEGCKFSALLTMFFAIPLSLEVKYCLTVWLGEIPEWAVLFVVLQLVQGIIVQLTNSAATGVYAQGDIKHYAIWKSVMNAMPVLVVWFAFMIGGGPVWLYIPMIVVWGIGGDIVILYFAEKKCGLQTKQFISDVLTPILFVALSMIACGLIPVLLMPTGIIRLLCTCFSTSIGMFAVCWFYAFTFTEKDLLKHLISRIIR